LQLEVSAHNPLNFIKSDLIAGAVEELEMVRGDWWAAMAWVPFERHAAGLLFV
jgi:hypothetical protein